MKTLDLRQGSSEWHAARARYFTASEAPVMMGASKKATRNDLLRMKATGSEQEFSRWVREVLFERGHEVEAKARPIAEKIVGEELFPATAVDDDDYLLASFDGITMLEDVTWECKQWNEAKAETVRGGAIPEEDRWQVVQQLLVSGADKALYMVTDGTEGRTVYTWLDRKDADFAALISGWLQFEKDLSEFQPEPEAVQPAGAAPESLPALRVEVTGMVTASNLAEFKQHALAVFDQINTDLQDDQDFANAEQTVKWCKDVESRLDATKNHALSQTATIDELFRTIDELKEQARQKRLHLDKLVKARKQAIREEILRAGEQVFDAHVESINRALPNGINLRLKSGEAAPDFASAMKGKKTVKSLRDAVDQELANAKIAANEVAERVRANLVTYTRLAEGYEHLFADLQQLVMKDLDDMEAVIKARIADHKAAEEKRLEAERERIRQEEQRKAEAQASQQAAREAAAEKDGEQQRRPAGSGDPAPMPRPAGTRSAPEKKGAATLRNALANWQHAYGISDEAMTELRAILRTYDALQEAA